MNSSTKNKHIESGIYLTQDSYIKTIGYISSYTYVIYTTTLLYDENNCPCKIKNYDLYMKLYKYNQTMPYQEIENLFS